jgi:hypothetical protein
MIWRVLGVVLLLGGIVCGVIAAVTWDDATIEGAYLNRSIGAPAYAGVFSRWGTSDGPPILLGAAIALAVAGILVLLVSVIQARRGARAPRSPGFDAGS